MSSKTRTADGSHSTGQTPVYTASITEGRVMLEDVYVNGAYLEKNPGWHIEESPWKARQVHRMLKKRNLTPHTICEVGCGAGEVLNELQKLLQDQTVLWGYDISPQAIALCRPKTNERLHFKLADIRREQDAFFEMLLVLDVFEHLEDAFSFLRALRHKGEDKIFHIPLDLCVHRDRSGIALGTRP